MAEASSLSAYVRTSRTTKTVAGMLAINLGVVLVAFTIYESSNGVNVNFLGMPLSTCFYVLYFLGSVMVIFGSRKFTRQPS